MGVGIIVLPIHTRRNEGMEGLPPTRLMVHQSFHLWSKKDVASGHEGEGGWVSAGIPGTSAVAPH